MSSTSKPRLHPPTLPKQCCRRKHRNLASVLIAPVQYVFWASTESIRPMRALSFSILPPILRILRSEEHTSELQSLMRTSYAVFCLQKNTSLYLNYYESQRLHCYYSYSRSIMHSCFRGSYA